jgi:TrmH family RNA methyltransferase
LNHPDTSHHQVITSRDNSLLRQARSVREGKVHGLIFVEGLRLCEEALHSKLAIESVIYSDEIAEKKRAREFLTQVEPVAKRLAVVNEKLLATISYTKTPQGIILIAARPDSGPEMLVSRNQPALLVILHNINNPVNVGAILRTAEAAGASGAVMTTQTSDPFSPKALRGAMGSAFRLPVWSGPDYEEALAFCRSHKLEVICADAGGTRIYSSIDWTHPTALVLGPESEGLSPEEIKAADHCVAVPMQGRVESLNVAVTAGVLMYEAVRQRRTKIDQMLVD